MSGPILLFVRKSEKLGKSVKKNFRYEDTWASRYMSQTLYPNHSFGYWMRPDDYLAMQEWDETILKNWIYSKWQPANAELIIVGKIDAAEAETLVRQYFNSWEYAGEGEPVTIAETPLPTETPQRSVFIFDKPIATQTQVNMACQIATKDKFDDRARSQVVGEVLSQMAWRKLREEAGVTYGAGAYAQVFSNGAGQLYMTSLVQNDATGFAVETMFDIIEAGSRGEVSEQGIADAKLSKAREYVLNQQSGQQMLNRLMGTGMENFDFFDNYGGQLAAASTEDFKELLVPCKDKDVCSDLQNQLKTQLKKKIDYELVDWEKKRRLFGPIGACFF